MNTLFLSSVFPNPTAPVRGTFNQMLCRALNVDGEVRVVAPRPWPECVRTFAKRSSSAGLHQPREHNPDNYQIERPIFLYPPKVLRHRYGQFMWRSVRKSVDKVTRDFTPDWVVSYWAHPDGEAAQLAAEQLGARSAVIIGGSDVLLLTRDARRREQIQKVLQNADAVLSVCDGLRHRAIELGASPERVHTLYQGIDPQVFSHDSRADARGRLGLSAEDAVFVWVGRMVDVKRLDVLVDSFEKALKSRPDAKLYLLGSGGSYKQVRKHVCSRGLCDSVIFVGPVNQQLLPDWYRAADATLLSSDSEGLPNVLRESLACGTPWVSTDVGSVQEIAAADHSIVVPRGDADRLGEAIVQCLDPFYKVGAASYRARTWADTANDLKTIFRADSTTSVVPKNVLEVCHS